MSIMKMATNNNLLSYGISTAPDPLQVSPQNGNKSFATLTIVVSNGTDYPIYCNQIQFSFDIGSDAQDLTNISKDILSSASPFDQWQISSTGAGVFTATPIDPGYNDITADGLVFMIYNIQVNEQVGTFVLTVDETSSTDNRRFSSYSNEYKITKFPYGFYVEDFHPSLPEVNNGQSVTLTWIGSDLATYTILYEDQSVDVTYYRKWLSPPLNSDTTFILKATAQSEVETVSTYLSTSVDVANPQITASSLTVLQTSVLQGALAAQGATTVGTPAANSNLTVNGNVSVTRNSTVNGTLAVVGNTTLATTTTGDLNTNGSLNATGMASFAYITSNSANFASIAAQSLAVNGLANLYSGCWVRRENGNGINVHNASDTYPAIWAENTVVRTGSKTTGIYSKVADSSDWGLYTNGRSGSGASSAMFTHVPTSDGYRVVTSPLSLEIEIQFSGQAQLSEGKASVQFEPAITEIISNQASYRVLLTPNERCNGLCTVHKSKSGFFVEELGEGSSSASFDWFIIARKAKSLEDKQADEMPDSLPDAISPEPPSE